VTLPTPDAQSPKPSSSHQAFAAHSIPASFPMPATPSLSSPSLPLSEMTAPSSGDNEHVSSAADFSHSWDLATGGFKILTAKRELPSPQQRRGQPASLAEPASEGNYLFLLVLLACLVVMLISGGVVLFMTLQP
jgi:hypothetical protein